MIEVELKKDSTWRRPTRPFGSGSNFHNFDFDDHFKDRTSKTNKNSNKLVWSLEQMNLTIKATIDEIKQKCLTLDLRANSKILVHDITFIS